MVFSLLRTAVTSAAVTVGLLPEPLTQFTQTNSPKAMLPHGQKLLSCPPNSSPDAASGGFTSQTLSLLETVPLETLPAGAAADLTLPSLLDPFLSLPEHEGLIPPPDAGPSARLSEMKRC